MKKRQKRQTAQGHGSSGGRRKREKDWQSRGRRPSRTASRVTYSEDGVVDDFGILLEKYYYAPKFAVPLLKRAKFLCEGYQQQLEEFEELNNSSEHNEGERLDLRKECIFTIDGSDAKDFDDAVSIKKTDSGYELGVHIADVSYFVAPDSGLDQEARKRGTSVYLIDKVIPMLPETISNYLYSLIKGETRFTVSCLMSLDLEGNLLKYRFCRSMICSCARLTYEQVDQWRGGIKTGVLMSADKEVLSSLTVMDELKTILRNKRMEEGSIDFISQEQKFLFNDKINKNDENEAVDKRNNGNSKITVALKTQLESEKLIEEFMLMANRCAALTMRDQVVNGNGVGVYRIHERPKEDKLYHFEQIVQADGISLPEKGYYNPLDHLDKESRPNRYRLFLEWLPKNLLNTAKQRLYSLLLLRSMNQAKYSIQNCGHYGLGFPYYTHFTSPIRRYPDLMVHRILLGGFANKPLKMLRKELRQVTKLSSEMERRAVDAEREYKKVKSMRYLNQLLAGGDKPEFEVTVVGFNARGDMFVQDNKTGIEGMVLFGFSREFYYDHEIGDNSEDKYGMGDEIRVKLETVSMVKLHANFSIVEE